MTDLGDFMDKILRPSGGGEPPSVREVAQEHLARYGSGRKAAKAWGVNESVFRRLVSGKTQSPKASTVARAYRTEREHSARRITNGDILIPVTERRPSRAKGTDRKTRGLTAAKLGITDPAAAERIRSAYIAGGPESAAAALLREINVPHYRKWLTPDSMRPRHSAGPARSGGGGGGPGAGGGGGPGGGGGGAGGGGGFDEGDMSEADYADSGYGYDVG
jgi:uncharacterized membrane protein YgcG